MGLVESGAMSSTGADMSRFIEGQDRRQLTLLPECLEDLVAEDKPVRVVEAFARSPSLHSAHAFRSTPHVMPVDGHSARDRGYPR